MKIFLLFGLMLLSISLPGAYARVKRPSLTSKKTSTSTTTTGSVTDTSETSTSTTTTKTTTDTSVISTETSSLSSLSSTTAAAETSPYSIANFIQDVFYAHNDLRAKHGVPPLLINIDLVNLAQQEADRYATSGEMVSNKTFYEGQVLGENFAFSQGSIKGF
jgi:uncharacterized protein YkwD